MPAQVILGLPYLSNGPLLDTARRLKAPILLSANAFARHQDLGPVPPGHEFTRLERHIRRITNDNRPPSPRQRARRMREWDGWNLASLRHAEGMEVHLDSAGFVAMAAQGGYSWTPESYILDLCARYPFARFSSMDLCVEQEVASDRDEVRERISKTINLNQRCHRLSCDAGIEDRLMPVIQGATPDDYLRCYDALAGLIGERRVIGVGSMCRRDTAGPNGIVAVVDALDRRLPPGVTLHIFGVKSSGGEQIAFMDRIASIDSQAYGITARQKAQEMRRTDPHFSKSNAFTAGIMEQWYLSQVGRMARSKPRGIQAGLPFGETDARPTTVGQALEMRARAEINQMIEDGELDHDQWVSHHMLNDWMSDWIDDLPPGTDPGDAFTGIGQLPRSLQDNEPYVDRSVLPGCLVA